MSNTIVHNEKNYTVSVSNSGKETIVTINDTAHTFTESAQSGNELSININGAKTKVVIASEKDDIFVFLDGRQYIFKKQEAGSVFDAGASSTAGNTISSLMPGTVIKIHCKEGDEVKKDDILVIVEAMKMENPLRAASDGKVAKINRNEGDIVSAGEVIVVLE